MLHAAYLSKCWAVGKGAFGGGGGGEGTVKRVGASTPLMWRNGPDSPSQVQGSMRLRGGLDSLNNI